MSNKALDLIIQDLNAEIAPLEKKRAEFEAARLAAFDFNDKNYFNGVEQKYEASIALIEKVKNIVRKHLK